MVSPSEILFSESDTRTSFRPKQINMEKIINSDNLSDLTLYDLRIIMLLLIQKGRKNKLEDALDNQTFNLSQGKNKHLFPNPNMFYQSIKKFTDMKLIQKIEGKQSTYMINPEYISNLTLDQAVSLGIKKAYKRK